MITILLHTPWSKKIARPFNRAASRNELVEMLERAGWMRNRRGTLGKRSEINLANVDTDEPVMKLTFGTQVAEFYAYRDRG